LQVPEPLSRYFTVHFLRTFTPQTLFVEWEDDFPILSAARQTLEDHFWQTYHKHQAKDQVYNGTICELRRYRWQNRTLYMTLGPVQFKSHLFSWMKGRPTTDSLPEGPHLGLGVSAVVLSSDKRLLFMKRSQNVAAAPGKFDVFGGHIDPEHHRPPDRPTAPPDPFLAISGELSEELNLSKDAVSSLRGLGMIANRFNGQPELVFLCRVDRSATELVQRASRAADRGEYSHIIHIPDDPEKLQKLLARYADDFSPSGLGSLWIYSAWKKRPRTSAIRDEGAR